MERPPAVVQVEKTSGEVSCAGKAVAGDLGAGPLGRPSQSSTSHFGF